MRGGISNLSGSYQAQTRALREAISNLQQETRRQAMTITPVQLAGSEIYEILKKRLIDDLPGEAVVAEVAAATPSRSKKPKMAATSLPAALSALLSRYTKPTPSILPSSTWWPFSRKTRAFAKRAA